MNAVCWLLLIVVLKLAHLGSSDSRINEALAAGTVSSEIEELSGTLEDVEKLRTLLKQLPDSSSSSSDSGNGTITATKQGPCQCVNGVCACCSRILYNTWKQKACVNVTYDPDEFSFTANILMNDRVLYTRTVSGM